MRTSTQRFPGRFLTLVAALLVVAGVGLAGAPAAAATPAAPAAPAPLAPSFGLEERPAFPLPAHLEQRDIAAGAVSHQQLVEDGRLLWHTVYNGLDGVGMKRTVGGVALNRFSVGPPGGGQPLAVAAQSCGGCHGMPFRGGAGAAHTQILFDDDEDGKPPFRFRSTTSAFGDGLLQLLAQEMTEEIAKLSDAAAAKAKENPGTPVKSALVAKGVEFGSITVTADAAGAVSFDPSGLRGLDPDLVVRPFGWKGNVTSLRAFQVLPATFGMGMMAEEFVWRLPKEAGADPDGDGVERELSVGDITAMAIYNAALEMPVDVPGLASAGLIPKPSAAALASVERGKGLFVRVGCSTCHQPEMRLANVVYEEPTMRGNGHYVDHFLLGKDADYDPKRPARVDLASEARPPRVAAASGGGGYVVRPYGDLKRHHMGRQLADPVGPQPSLTPELAPLEIDGKMPLIGADEWMTAELWGAGNTGPYLHDGRAGSLGEAIALHGEDSPPAAGDAARSEAQEARDAYLALPAEDRAAVVTFLKSLVNFSPAK